MPPPRKPSPRRSRRSRSRSYSPRHSRKRSHSRSPRPKRKSRTPERKRGKSPKQYETEMSYRHRSPSPKRSPPRKSHMMHERRSPSKERDYLVKRSAESSGKRHGYRSRSGSPAASKRPRESSRYEYKEEKPYSSKRNDSPSPPSSHKGRRYEDEPSSSSRPLFPIESKPKKEYIDLVRIIDKKERLKLYKRFQTEEQRAEGPFDFEENITIGIHRGPNHLDQEAVHVNFVYDPKAFVMLFPKKDYKKRIFQREEILAFRHDDNLDEETYVEKRTITVKPSNKPKSKWEDQSDYKITIGADREGYGDRRMVHDSGSRSRSSRQKYYEQDVKIKLDPKPDPRYEKLYREQQKKEEEAVLNDKIHRNPNDLRYNLMKKTDRRPDRSPHRDVEDARSRIEARRRDGWSPERPERREGRSSREPPERKKITIKTDLPDFKNRPDKYHYKTTWQEHPEEIPKGDSYYEHDNRSRDDMTYWERKQMYLETGRYPSRGRFFRARGRGFRGRFIRGFTRRPRGRGFIQRGGFIPGRRPSSGMDVWKHDKFSENEFEEEEEEGEDDESRDYGEKSKGDRKKEHKDKHRSKDGKKDKKKDKRDKEDERFDHEKIQSEEDAMMSDVKVELSG